MNDQKKGKIMEDSDNLSIKGHRGTWYVVDGETIDNVQYFLLEHEEYGDTAPHLIVNDKGYVALEDVWNGFDDLVEHFAENPPPDPSITQQEMIDYGYTWEGMLPLQKERALELLEHREIFRLDPTGSEAVIETVEEIEEHEGLFGIEQEHWERFHNREIHKSEQKEQDDELEM